MKPFLIIIIMLSVASCAGPKKINQTGNYTIPEVVSRSQAATVVKFSGYGGMYTIMHDGADSLYVGKQIKLNVITINQRRSHAKRANL